MTRRGSSDSLSTFPFSLVLGRWFIDLTAHSGLSSPFPAERKTRGFAVFYTRHLPLICSPNVGLESMHLALCALLISPKASFFADPRSSGRPGRLSPLSILVPSPTAVAALDTPTSCAPSPPSTVYSPACSDVGSLGEGMEQPGDAIPPSLRRTMSLSSLVAGGKQRRKRSRTTQEQLAKLEEYFAADQSPTSARRRDIAQELGLDERQTQIWFQNRSVLIFCQNI